MRYVVFIWITLLFHPAILFSKTIKVPEDIPVIQQAIDQSQDQDVILIKSGTYDEQLVIENKTISLQGYGQDQMVMFSKPDDEYYRNQINVLLIKNSNVLLKWFYIKYLNNSKNVYIENSNVEISGCDIYMSGSIRSSPYGDMLQIFHKPAIHLVSCMNKSISVNNSSLHGTDKYEVDENLSDMFGFREYSAAPMTIENCTNTVIRLSGNQITGAAGVKADFYRGGWTTNGGSAIQLNHSRQMQLFMDNNSCSAGSGGGAFSYIIIGNFDAAKPSYGGPGLMIMDSSVDVHGGVFIGGKSGHGGDFEIGYFTEPPKGTIHYDGERGGPGIMVKKHSAVNLFNTESIGGAGGEPNGQHGEAIVIDETSTLARYNFSLSKPWMLYN